MNNAFNQRYQYKSNKWEPNYLLVDPSIIFHPKTEYIKQRCPGADVHILNIPTTSSDSQILKSISCFRNLNVSELAIISRKSLLLTSERELFQSMSVGHTEERCCYNFLKIIPYKGVCQASCGYCWFQDKVLLPRVNVTFVDEFIRLLNSDHSEKYKDTVFTMTHYKTDCVCIEHVMGIIQDLHSRTHEFNGAYVQILTKFSDFDFLYSLPSKKEFIICFSINTQTVNEVLEPNTSRLSDRISTAKKLKELGYTVLFRVDPMLWYDGFECEYANLAKKILTEIIPHNITLGTPRFQSFDEVMQCLNNLNYDQKLFFFKTTNLIEKCKPGIPISGENHSRGAYFKNMPFSLPYSNREILYKSIIKALRSQSFYNIGLCEEPISMWDSLELKRSGNSAQDCSCNYLP